MKTHSWVIVFLLIIPHLYPVSINPHYASLTAKGPAVKITVKSDYNEPFEILHSDNIYLSSDTTVTYLSDFNLKDTKAWVIVKSQQNDKSDTCFISVVPWLANVSELKITKVINERYAILGKTDDTLLVVFKNKLYKTGGDLNALTYLSDFELKSSDYYWGYLRTPVGSFIRKDKDIFYSQSEKNWVLDYTTKGRGVRNSFTYIYDSISLTTHLFTHDYSVTGQDTFPHSVYRKTITPTKISQWNKVFTFYSKDQWAQNKTLFPSCRHIHTVVSDPFTGHIWIGTGDLDQHSHIYYSDDNGATWKHVGMGSQEWRVLSIWFTEGYVYWSMDTSAPSQRIFRINRETYRKNGIWPDMSIKLSEGNLKQNVRYMLLSLTNDNYYFKQGYNVGDIVYGNSKVVLNDSNTVYALNDPKYDYRELVAYLPNNALWAYTTVHDQRGDEVVLLSANGEGQAIDNRPRIFGIKEKIDGSVDVQEVLSTNTAKSAYSQFYPYEQDALGNIYFQTDGLNTYPAQGLVQTQLIWNDSSQIDKVNLEARGTDDPNKLLLTLSKHDLDSLVWQKCVDQRLKWTSISNLKITSDSLTVFRDSMKTVFYRALIYKKKSTPVASNYVKIEKKVPINNDKNIKLDTHNLKYSFISNGNQKQLIITRTVDSVPEVLKIVLYDISGKVFFMDSNNFMVNNYYETNFSHFQKGLYLLRVYDGSRNYLLTKLIFN